MSILFPVAVGEPNDFALLAKGALAYTQNAGLDGNGDGRVTKREALGVSPSCWSRAGCRRTGRESPSVGPGFLGAGHRHRE